MSPPLADLYEQATQINYVRYTRLVYNLGRWTLPWLLQTINIATALNGILVRVLLGANSLNLLVSAHSWADVQQRAEKLAVLNLLPLDTGLTFGLPAHLRGIRRSAVVWSHRWFGRVMAAHSLLHGAISIAKAASLRYDWVSLLGSPPRHPSTMMTVTQWR
ncbi:hypothetical protein BDQ94DRAFT_164054 [Aspergillus welwitschiae]|uniref:Ferric oxidoreductase domain-containing protein n=1 Tax=Aspergillus welwitschiae TaxID=1341132 RepID=A0A3F3PJ18_9EURO|nr:hypothetical protein BDQ94DRAFT_164054 [Aspergillus welwitschiae]RDH26940.1 hypothetical protein BDQ94DRAFT_164054 [Aspergillus welwitschiae]